MADEMRFVATNVTAGIVPASGHWIMEENPQATIALITKFTPELAHVIEYTLAEDQPL